MKIDIHDTGLEMGKSQKGGKSELKRRKFANLVNKEHILQDSNQKSPSESRKNTFLTNFISYKNITKGIKKIKRRKSDFKKAERK